MAIEAKLNVYTITLNPAPNCYQNSNRWLFRHKIGQANTSKLEESFIMTEIFRQVIGELDQPNMYSDPRTFKCMTANQGNIENDAVDANINLHSEKFIIEGKIEGGNYGRKRNKTLTTNKTERSPVSDKDAITDDFYFLLYSPFRSARSILMVQSYSSETIDSVMKKFWQRFLMYPSHFRKPTIRRYVPASIIDDFKENATVSSFSFTTDVPGKTLLDASSVIEERNFKVTIQISPIDEDLNVADFEKTIEPIQKNFFTKYLSLSQFKTKKGTLKDNNTKKPLHLS